MEVDYELHLLERFHGAAPALRSRAKGFVARVNASSAGFLEELAARAARGLGDDPGHGGYVDDLRGRLREDDARLDAEADDVLGEIRRRARGGPGMGRRAWLRRAAAAGIAAEGAFLPSCRRTQPFEMAGSPPPDLPLGDPGPLHAALLPVLADRLRPPRDAALEISVLDGGGIESRWIRSPKHRPRSSGASRRTSTGRPARIHPTGGSAFSSRSPPTRSGGPSGAPT